MNNKEESQSQKFFKLSNRFDQLFVVLIFLCVCFLGIGYAQVGGIDLSIDGSALALKQSGIVITNVQLLSSNNADTSCSKINSYYQSNMDSKVCLNNSSDSTVTYQVTIKNVDTVKKQYVNTIYSEEMYSNSDITFELDGISKSTVLDGGGRSNFYYYI